MSPAELTFIAEACRDLEKLREYAAHESPLVREGACYGLESLLRAARRELRRLAEYNPSPGVREAAREALED